MERGAWFRIPYSVDARLRAGGTVAATREASEISRHYAMDEALAQSPRELRYRFSGTISDPGRQCLGGPLRNGLTATLSTSARSPFRPRSSVLSPPVNTSLAQQFCNACRPKLLNQGCPGGCAHTTFRDHEKTRVESEPSIKHERKEATNDTLDIGAQKR